MTQPTIVPVGFANTATDYLKVKADKSGNAIMNRTTVSVPTGTTTTTTIGLVPFTSGCLIGLNSSAFASDALGTSVTLSFGVAYATVGDGTDAPTLFSGALTGAAAGGELDLVPSVTNLPYVTTGNGWIIATVGGATTTTTGNIQGQVVLDYFTGGIQ